MWIEHPLEWNHHNTPDAESINVIAYIHDKNDKSLLRSQQKRHTSIYSKHSLYGQEGKGGGILIFSGKDKKNRENAICSRCYFPHNTQSDLFTRCIIWVLSSLQYVSDWRATYSFFCVCGIFPTHTLLRYIERLDYNAQISSCVADVKHTAIRRGFYFIISAFFSLHQINVVQQASLKFIDYTQTNLTRIKFVWEHTMEKLISSRFFYTEISPEVVRVVKCLSTHCRNYKCAVKENLSVFVCNTCELTIKGTLQLRSRTIKGVFVRSILFNHIDNCT